MKEILILGQILKNQREAIGKSQRDIADKLEYRNANFISMIESGRSNPPTDRINDVVKAYGLTKEWIPVLIKTYIPKAWDAVRVSMTLGTEKTEKDVDMEVKKILDEKLKSYNILI